MKKHIITVSYWLGLLSSLFAVGLRVLNLFGVLRPNMIQQAHTLWYMTFYKGAVLFFLIAIATVSYASACGEKT